jgi:hypothetical protein
LARLAGGRRATVDGLLFPERYPDGGVLAIGQPRTPDATTRAACSVPGTRNDPFRVALQKMAQPLRHRENPLPQRQVRQDVIGEMRCRPYHAPRVACGAYAAPLAGERNQEVVAALPAPRPGRPWARMPHSK